MSKNWNQIKPTMCSPKHFLPCFHCSLVLAKLEGMQDIGSKGRRLQLQLPLLRPPVLPYSAKASLFLTVVFWGFVTVVIHTSHPRVHFCTVESSNSVNKLKKLLCVSLCVGVCVSLCGVCAYIYVYVYEKSEVRPYRNSYTFKIQEY